MCTAPSFLISSYVSAGQCSSCKAIWPTALIYKCFSPEKVMLCTQHALMPSPHHWQTIVRNAYMGSPKAMSCVCPCLIIILNGCISQSLSLFHGPFAAPDYLCLCVGILPVSETSKLLVLQISVNDTTTIMHCRWLDIHI